MSFSREKYEQIFDIQCLLHKDEYKSYFFKSYIYYMFNYNSYRYILSARFKNELYEQNISHELDSNEGKR